MALKNIPEVKHMIFTGAVRELNFYVADMIRQGFSIKHFVVLNAPKDNVYSETSMFSLLYVFVKDNASKDA